MTHAVPQVRGYLVVFGALLVLTVVTVGVSYLHLPRTPTVAVGAHHRVVKAALVAMFFMHLKGERPMVFWPLGADRGAVRRAVRRILLLDRRRSPVRHAVRRRVRLRH